MTTNRGTHPDPQQEAVTSLLAWRGVMMRIDIQGAEGIAARQQLPVVEQRMLAASHALATDVGGRPVAPHPMPHREQRASSVSPSRSARSIGRVLVGLFASLRRSLAVMAAAAAADRNASTGGGGARPATAVAPASEPAPAQPPLPTAQSSPARTDRRRREVAMLVSRMLLLLIVLSAIVYVMTRLWHQSDGYRARVQAASRRRDLDLDRLKAENEIAVANTRWQAERARRESERMWERAAAQAAPEPGTPVREPDPWGVV